MDDNTELNLERFYKIKTEFFGGNSKSLFKSLVTNKNLKIIVFFVYNIVNYVLAPEKSTTGETAPSDTHSHTVKDDTSTSEITNPTPRSVLVNKETSSLMKKKEKKVRNMKQQPSARNLQ